MLNTGIVGSQDLSIGMQRILKTGDEKSPIPPGGTNPRRRPSPIMKRTALGISAPAGRTALV